MRGWNCARDGYACPDRTFIELPRRTAIIRGLDEQRTVPASGIVYALDAEATKLLRTRVSNLEFDRAVTDVFEGPNELRTLTTPNTLRDVREYAFYDAAALRSVVLNPGLEALGTGDDDSGAFQNAGLTRVQLPGSLKKIKVSELYGCDQLKTVYVDEACEIYLPDLCTPPDARIGPPPDTMAGKVRVWDLRQLRVVAIPEGVEKIGRRWFWGSGVERVEIPSSVREVGPGAFHGCEGLEKITFAGATSPQCRSQLKTISAEAFRDCASLKNVELPDGLEEIGLCAFDGSGLESIATPPSVRTIRQGAFFWCNCLRRAVLNEGLEVLGTDEDPSRAEYWCGVFQLSALESVTLPSTLKRIEHGAFRTCDNLKSIALPEKLEYIGKCAFSKSGLESVAFPRSVKAISREAFERCDSLKTVVINEGLEALGTDDGDRVAQSGMFQQSAVEDVRLPSTLRRIGGRTFSKFDKLKVISLPEGLECIGPGCFSNSGLEEIRLPSSVRAVGAMAFKRCRELRRVQFSDGLERIGAGAFAQSGIANVVLPSGVKTIGGCAFAKCERLRTVRLNEGLERLGAEEKFDDQTYKGEVFWESALKSIAIPSTLKVIECRAFEGCKNLKKVEFPEGMESLGGPEKSSDTGSCLFKDSRVKEVVLPSTVREISPKVFGGCDSLRTVRVARDCPVDVEGLVGSRVKVKRR